MQRFSPAPETDFVPARTTPVSDEVQRLSLPPAHGTEFVGPKEDAYVADESVIFHLDAMRAITQETRESIQEAIQESHERIRRALERERTMLGLHERSIERLTRLGRP